MGPSKDHPTFCRNTACLIVEVVAMFVKPFRFWALLCFVLVLQLATAQSFQVIRRVDDASPTSTGVPSATTNPPHETGKSQESNDDGASQTKPTPISTSITASPTSGLNSTASETATGPTPTSTSLTKSTFFNGTFIVYKSFSKDGVKN